MFMGVLVNFKGLDDIVVILLVLGAYFGNFFVYGVFRSFFRFYEYFD